MNRLRYFCESLFIVYSLPFISLLYENILVSVHTLYNIYQPCEHHATLQPTLTLRYRHLHPEGRPSSSSTFLNRFQLTSNVVP